MPPLTAAEMGADAVENRAMDVLVVRVGAGLAGAIVYQLSLQE
jgi:hypothetical protein